MINKEQKYRNELFELIKNSIEIDEEDTVMLELVKEVFITDSDEIKVEEILNKLTSDEQD